MNINTHLAIDRGLCGTPVTVSEGHSLVRLDMTDAMRADDRGLIHGGFVFGAADYAAMLAVNHPNVVLGSAECKFLKPVKADDTIYAEARVTGAQDKKRTVSVSVRDNEIEVFQGTFTCFVLPQHVLGHP